MTSFPRRTEKSKTELSPSQKGKNTFSRFSGFKVFLFIFVSAFFWSETSFAVVHSVENISEKVKGDRLSLSDVNSILGTIRGFFFDDLTNFVGIGTTNPTAKLEVAGIIRSNNSNLGTVEFTGNSYKIEGGANLGDLRFSAPRFRFYQDGNTDVDPLLNLSSGSVGIGTSNPGAKLEVNAGYSSEQFILRREDDGTNNGAYSLGADSAGLKFWSGGFATDSTPDIVFDSDGNVGIGTTSPDAKLDIVNGGQRLQFLTGDNTSDYRGYISLNDDSMNIGNNSTSRGLKLKNGNGTLFTVASGGAIGIRTEEPGYSLHVNGTAYAAGAAGALSDSRHKNTIENLKYGLDEVLQLRPVNFMWNAEKVADHGMSGVQLGLIAQEVEGILPEVVLTAPDQSQTKSIKYSALIPPMIQAIKDLESRDRAQQLQIAELQAELAALR